MTILFSFIYILILNYCKHIIYSVKGQGVWEFLTVCATPSLGSSCVYASSSAYSFIEYYVYCTLSKLDCVQFVLVIIVYHLKLAVVRILLDPPIDFGRSTIVEKQSSPRHCVRIKQRVPSIMLLLLLLRWPFSSVPSNHVF